MHLAAGILIALFASQSDQKPEWCRDLPRPAYRTLERVKAEDPRAVGPRVLYS